MSAAPGWYAPDPNNPRALRYWDGNAWTEWQTQQLPAPPFPAPTASAPGPEPRKSGLESPLSASPPIARANGRWIAIGVAAVVGILAIAGIAVATSKGTAKPTAAQPAASTPTTSASAVAPPSPTATPTPASTKVAATKPKPVPTKTAAAVRTLWYPRGYIEYSDGLAFAYAPLKKFQCDTYTACWGVYVIARDGCPSSLYIEISVTQGGSITGYANDLQGTVPAMRRVLLKPSTFSNDGRGLTGELTKLTCY
jgi:hypothetical protein